MAGTRALFRWRVTVGVLDSDMVKTDHPVSHVLPTCEGGSCSGSVGMGLFWGESWTRFPSWAYLRVPGVKTGYQSCSYQKLRKGPLLSSLPMLNVTQWLEGINHVSRGLDHPHTQRLSFFLHQGSQKSVEGDPFNSATNSWSGWRESGGSLALGLQVIFVGTVMELSSLLCEE